MREKNAVRSMGGLFFVVAICLHLVLLNAELIFILLLSFFLFFAKDISLLIWWNFLLHRLEIK